MLGIGSTLAFTDEQFDTGGSEVLNSLPSPCRHQFDDDSEETEEELEAECYHRSPQHLREGLEQALKDCSVAHLPLLPATQSKYYNTYELSGPIIFHAAELCAHGQDEAVVQNFDSLLSSLDLNSSPSYVASYKFYGRHLIHVMHFAASLGSIHIMDKLLMRFGKEVVHEKTRLILDLYKSARGLQRLSNLVHRRLSRLRHREEKIEQAEALASVKDAWQSMESIRNYTPLLSALYMSQTRAVIWLIDREADVNTNNCDGFTPLHILAKGGLPYSPVGRADMELEQIVVRLLKCRANLSALTAAGYHDEKHRERTPLQIACLKDSRFSKKMLRLLMQCYHKVDNCRPLEEIWNVANINPKAAETITNDMKNSKDMKWKRKVLARMLREIHQVESVVSQPSRSVESPVTNHSQSITLGRLSTNLMTFASSTFSQRFYSQDKENSFVRMLCDILRHAPFAAADILDSLTHEPRVQERQKNPLPNVAKLQNHAMWATYQSDVGDRRSGGVLLPSWNYKPEMEIPWHKELKPSSADLAYQSKIYFVRIRVVIFPNWLRLQTMYALVLVGDDPANLPIFGRLPIQGAITCLWRHSVRSAHNFHMLLEAVLLTGLVYLGRKGSHKKPWKLAISWCQGTVIREILVMIYEMSSFRSQAQVQSFVHFIRSYFYHFGSVLICPFALMLLVPVLEEAPSELDPGIRLLLAANVFARSCQFLLMLRVFRGVGQIIHAVVLSFVPLRFMLLLIILFFFIFWGVFVSLNHTKHAEDVLKKLYTALFFGESSGLDAISGFGWDAFDDAWLLRGSAVFMVAGGVLFSVCLLNLIIAMYGSYYQSMVPIANLTFHRGRIQKMMRLWMQPGMPEVLQRYLTPSQIMLGSYGLAACSLILFLVLLFVYDLVLPSALALTFFGWLGQAYFRCRRWNGGLEEYGRKPNYLWICYRDDFKEEGASPSNEDSVNSMKSALETLQKDVASLSESMREMKEQLLVNKETLDSNQRLKSEVPPERHKTQQGMDQDRYTEL